MSTTKRVKTALIVALVPRSCDAWRRNRRRRSCPCRRRRSSPTREIPARLGDPASWRTPEFLRDNGMLSIGAEFAYAAGYSGTGMNIGIVDSGFFAGHMREHGSLDTNYAVGDRYLLGGGPGRRHGPDAGVLRPGVQRQPRHARQRDRRRKPRRRRRDAAHRPRSPTCTASRSTATSTSGNTHKTDGVFYGLLPATATAAQTPDNAYLGNVYRAVNAARYGERQADQAHHQQLGQPAADGELQHATSRRPAARRASA